MDTFNETKEKKKAVLKDIIQKLHKGLSLEEAKDRFIKEIGEITASEIAELEQSLIVEGMSPDEIKKFCNVHAMLFESSLKTSMAKEESPAHPVSLFKAENRKIEQITAELKKSEDPKEVGDLLNKLKGIEIHYTRKEQVLFPYLERYGFMGPSKVMWAKDDEVRMFLKEAISNVKKVSEDQTENYSKKYLLALIQEVEGMIFKEENILFPASMEKLTPNDWLNILKESNEVGYVFIEKPKETSVMINELKNVLIEEPTVSAEGLVAFPSGTLKLPEIMYLFNSLPFDMTFVDAQDKVRYFTEGKERTFVRTRSIIGRDVKNCHPPQSVHVVEKILKSFKEGKKDHADFWINMQGKLVYIRYFAVRDTNKCYLGTLEVTQDITEIKHLEGERRILDEKD